jgi:tRNA(fMet)-specific endonuclease VapC
LLERRVGEAARRLQDRIDRSGKAPAVTTIISYEEQTRGWLAYLSKARTAAEQIDAYRRLNGHLAVFRTIHVLDFDAPAAATPCHGCPRPCAS